MFTFTIVLTDKSTSSSLIITYPSYEAAGTLLALGVEAARAVKLQSQDERALYTRDALPIPPADFVYYVDVNTQSGKSLRLFQAHYVVQELFQGDRSVMTSLLPRTRSVTLFSAPTDRLDEDVLSPLLILLRQLEIAPEKVLFTICVPTQRGLPCSQQQMMNILVKRQILKPRFFGLVVKDRNELGEAYRQACPNFWNKAQGEFAEVRLVDCVLGSVGDVGYSKMAGAFQECAWGEYADLLPHGAIQMALTQDVSGLLALQASDGQRRLLLSTLMNVVLHSDETSQRAAVINVWNRIDHAIGTDWLLPLLNEDDPMIRQATVDSMSSRRPVSVERLVNMALDERVDRYRGARLVVIGAEDERIVELLIDALDSRELSRRRTAQDILVQLSTWSRPALIARMEGEAYRGRIGAAVVLARLGDGEAQRFLEAEFHHTKWRPGRRRIIQEGFEAWDAQQFQRLVEEEAQQRHQTVEERKGQLRGIFVNGWLGAALGSGIFWVSGQVALRGVVDSLEPYRWYGVSTNPTLAVTSIVCGALVGLILGSLLSGYGRTGENHVVTLSVGGGAISGAIAGLIVGIALMIDGSLQYWDNPFESILCFPLDLIITLGMHGKSILTGGIAGSVLGLILGIVCEALRPSPLRS